MLKKLPGMITSSETVSHIGKIENIVGMAMEASGGAGSIGDIVMIYNEDLKKQVPAEVVGFHEDMLQLMAYDLSLIHICCGSPGGGNRSRGRGTAAYPGA